MALRLRPPPACLPIPPAFHILGLDTGLKNYGWAVISFTAASDWLEDCGHILTEKSNKKLNVRAASDNIRRGCEVVQRLQAIMARWKPCLISIEAQSLVRNSSVNFQLGIGFGAAISEAARAGLPIVDFPPADIKFKLTGKRSASKDDVVEALVARKGYETFYALAANLAEGKWEHPADACGAAICALDCDVVKLARAQLQ